MAIRVAEEARDTIPTAGLSARAQAEIRLRESVALAGMYFAASMAHSNLTLMAGDDPIEVNYVLAPDVEKALDADG